MGRLSHFLGYITTAVNELMRSSPWMLPGAISDHAAASSSNEAAAAGEYGILKDFVAAYSSESPPPLLVFGDSVFLRVAADEESQLPLGEMLKKHYRKDVFLISGSGYHPEVFGLFAAVLEKLPALPLVAVVPINLRAFSPTWDLNPLYQFHSEIGLLSSFAVNRPSYRLQNLALGAGLENNAVQLGCYGQKSITLGDFLDIVAQHPEFGSAGWRERLKTIFHYHYQCPLYPGHRKLQALIKTIRLLSELGVSVYSYITPINYEGGVEYCGDSFVGVVEKNIATLQREISSAMYSLPNDKANDMFRLDNFSFRCARDVFFTSHNATEHLRSLGREFLSRRIIECGAAHS